MANCPLLTNSGLAGRQIELLVYDEAGGGTKQVTELRNKVQKDNVDAIIALFSALRCPYEGCRGTQSSDHPDRLRHTAGV